MVCVNRIADFKSHDTCKASCKDQFLEELVFRKIVLMVGARLLRGEIIDELGKIHLNLTRCRIDFASTTADDVVGFRYAAIGDAAGGIVEIPVGDRF